MTRDEFAADVRRVEERLAAGRLRTQQDWSALGAAVARKTSWAPLALAAAGAAVLMMTLRRGTASPSYIRGRGHALRETSPKWAPVLGAGVALLRIVTSPQALALWRTLRSRRP